MLPLLIAISCILSKFYIKPQLSRGRHYLSWCCILSKFYIKPQQQRSLGFSYVVVSYRNSTSNHNDIPIPKSTPQLYLIEILHQTTTVPSTFFLVVRLYLIEILHQTTTEVIESLRLNSCILSKFYIKPQQRFVIDIPNPVVSYRNSTSNHNSGGAPVSPGRLYLIEILHQTTTSISLWLLFPQLYLIEILHQTTTSG